MNREYKNTYTQVVVAQPITAEELPDQRYQAMSGLAVVSLICGVLSFLTFVSWMLVVVPAVGVALGWFALRQIRRNPEETTGAPVAWAGIALSALWAVAGFGWNYYVFYHAVPTGYELLEYTALQTDPNDPEQRVSPDAEMFDKRKVFIRGFMYPTKQQAGIKEFLLVDDQGACSFCAPQPKATQLIRVKLIEGLKMSYTTRMIGVGGEFTIHTDPKEEGMGGLVYQIEADCLR